MKSTSLHFCPLILLPLLLISAAAGKSITPEKNDLIEKSCVHASYPDVCLRTLSTYGGAAATTLRELAQVAVRDSLAHVRRASNFLAELKAGSRKEPVALTDCVEQMADSVDELSRTLAVLRQLGRGAEFRWQMSNAETWVSAALTNEDTCLDGFREIGGKVRSDLRGEITEVARVTSNALYLINLVDQ